MKEVRLFAGDQLVQRKVSFPFQMRYQPTAADVGHAVVLRTVAEDSAGNTAEAHADDQRRGRRGGGRGTAARGRSDGCGQRLPGAR